MGERQYVDGTRGGASLLYEKTPDNFDLKSCLTNEYQLYGKWYYRSCL